MNLQLSDDDMRFIAGYIGDKLSVKCDFWEQRLSFTRNLEIMTSPASVLGSIASNPALEMTLKFYVSPVPEGEKK